MAQAAPAWPWQAKVSGTPELDAGFHLLYELKPEEARAKFAAWQASHPEDPLGSAAEAASYLFEECYRQDVLTSEYFLDDKRFLGKIAIKPDPQLRDAFFAAELRSRDLAGLQLEADPNDVNALFVMTLSLGMQADYAGLIEKQQIESLAMIREADKFAKRLLAIDPDAADAYLTLGAANYIIGSLPRLKRFFLRFKGIKGNKRRGIEQLEIAAARGRYLRPFAKIMLAMAALREKRFALAQTQLLELVAEFPQNPLFVSELAKLDASRSATAPLTNGSAQKCFKTAPESVGIARATRKMDAVTRACPLATAASVDTLRQSRHRGGGHREHYTWGHADCAWPVWSCVGRLYVHDEGNGCRYRTDSRYS